MANGQKISPILTDDASVEDLGPGGLLNGNRYSSVHPDATSDGDNAGRGDVGNGVGTNNDQMELKKLLYSSGNKYKPGSGYFNIDYIQEYW